MFFNLFQIFFSQQLYIFRRHITPLGRQGVDKSFFLKLFIGTFRSNKADAKILRKTPNGWKQFIFFNAPLMI